MRQERGLDVDHSTVWRWVQSYAPDSNKRIRPYLNLAGVSYRVDETYIKVGKTCKYLYRAGDKADITIEFMLSAKRDSAAAQRVFKQQLRADHRSLPLSSSVDKNAAYPEAFTSSQAEKLLPKDCKLRRVQYLNNLIGAIIYLAHLSRYIMITQNTVKCAIMLVLCFRSPIHTSICWSWEIRAI